MASPKTATASCFCSTVKLEFPVDGPDVGDTHICHCSDCHKISASMFASNFIVRDSALKHLQGQDKLAQYARNDTIASGNTMTNFFCSVCGTLMYRRSSGFPGLSITRIGTIDDPKLMETAFKPKVEQFIETRTDWVKLDVEKEVKGQSSLGEVAL